MIKRLSILPALFLVALATLALGCGGNDGVAKAEFIKEAEAICKRIHSAESQARGEYIQKNLARLNRLSPSESNKSIGIIIETIRMPAVLKEVKELKALEPPEGDEKKLQKIFVGTEEGIKKVNEEPKLALASRAGNPLYPSYKLALDYGFENCAES